MRKEDLISDILYLAMAAIVLLVGFLVIQPAINDGLLGRDMGQNVLFILIALIIGIIINVALMEIGHLIGAKIGGYKILSTNILGFNFYRVFDKNSAKSQLKFRFKSFNGLSGETIIEPKKESSNPFFYIFTPLILFLLEFVAMYFVISLAPQNSETFFEGIQILKYGLIISTTIAGCIVLYDYFPAKLDTLNDGYRLISLSKKINIIAYNEKLKNDANEYKGIKNTEYKIFDEITDFTAKVNLDAAINEFLDGKNEESLAIIDKCLSDASKISHSTKTTLLLDKIYITYLTKGSEEGTKLFKELDQETNEYVKKCKDLESIRVYALYIGLNEKSQSEVKYAITKAKKEYERLTVGEVEKEKKLLLKVIYVLMDFDVNLIDDTIIKYVCDANVESEDYKDALKYFIDKGGKISEKK